VIKAGVARAEANGKHVGRRPVSAEKEAMVQTLLASGVGTGVAQRIKLDMAA
jgi:hypothetical protein